MASNDRLIREVAVIRRLAQTALQSMDAGRADEMPGRTLFLDDGRVLCCERRHGDSRYPYGRDGLNFWVHASGYMHGNIGAYTLFLPVIDGREPQVAFFAGVKETEGNYRPLSLLPVPYMGEHESAVERRYCVLGHDAAYFVLETKDLRSVVRVFIDQSGTDAVQIAFSVLLENNASQNVDLFASAYLNPLCRHQLADTCEDRWFKQVTLANAPTDADSSTNHRSMPPFVVTVNEDLDRFRSYSNCLVVRRHMSIPAHNGAPLHDGQVCTSRRGYVGDLRRSLAQADFLRTGQFEKDVPLTVFNDVAIAGDLNRFSLPPGATARFDYLLSLPAAEDMENHCNTPISPEYVDERHERVQSAQINERHDLDIHVHGSSIDGVSDATLNHFVPFLRKQVKICAETRGFMQASPQSLIGIRDVFQAIEGALYDQPEAARAKILEAIEYVLVDGRCPRQYSLPVNGTPGRVDLREFIDQGVWVISTLHTYVAVSGDSDLLSERVGYHRLKEGAGEGIERAEETDAVIDHLIRIMDYLNRHRDPDSGLLRAMYGDWNDALDGLGVSSTPGQQYGSGVSIMASLQLYRNCAEMIELLEKFFPKRYTDRVNQYLGIRAALSEGLLRYGVVARDGQQRIVHGWGDRRAYYVGSFRDSDGVPRDGLTSNAFWVISGMLEEDASLRDTILKSFERLDSPYGLKTFEPGFQPDAPGVGRIPKLPIGTAENGATYIHATAFGILALFMLGEPQRAWDQIVKILPFAPHQKGLSHSPFVMPNSYIHNPALNLAGQNMNDWQTGSSNVLLKLLIRHVFGFMPGLDQLTIAPAAWSPFDGFDFTCRAHGRLVQVRLVHGDVPERRFCLNGKALPTTIDDSPARIACIRLPYDSLDDQRPNLIEITEPRQRSTRPSSKKRQLACN